MDAIRASCLQMQDHIGAIKMTSKGDILLEKPGELYVGGLYICKTEMKYGYNIKPEFIKLERDRQTVSSYDLCDIMNCFARTTPARSLPSRRQS